MARRTFSFDYEQDNWRARQVRNSWITKEREATGVRDTAGWGGVKKQGDAAIKKWIDDQLVGMSVTVVLIGSETSTRQYVTTRYRRAITGATACSASTSTVRRT